MFHRNFHLTYIITFVKLGFVRGYQTMFKSSKRSNTDMSDHNPIKLRLNYICEGMLHRCKYFFRMLISGIELLLKEKIKLLHKKLKDKIP